MLNSLSQAVEEWLGIKADPEDIKKFQDYLWKTYGGENSEILKKVFLSGEAAGFLTVNETYFFREPVHFAFLKSLLPSFDQSGIRICSAATATGCEAYSIAMLIETYNKGRTPLMYHIDAFDVNPKAIETACVGIYGTRAMREDGDCFHYLTAPYMKNLPATQKFAEAGYLVDPSLKKNISFFVHNLMNEIPSKVSNASLMYDVVFFRNAFIYFSLQNRERILSNLSAVLKEGGILIMGVSETAGVDHADFTQKNENDVFYFQKTAIYRS